MKKRARKLSLNRETLSRLQNPEAGRVAGGTSGFPTCFPQPMATDCGCETYERPDCYEPTLCFGTCSC
jgi:hypothetical protein